MSTLEFSAPKGFVPPEGSEAEFDMVCSFKVRGGKLCLTKLGDTPMSEGERESKPDYSEMANAIAASAQGKETPT